MLNECVLAINELSLCFAPLLRNGSGFVYEQVLLVKHDPPLLSFITKLTPVGLNDGIINRHRLLHLHLVTIFIDFAANRPHLSIKIY